VVEQPRRRGAGTSRPRRAGAIETIGSKSYDGKSISHGTSTGTSTKLYMLAPLEQAAEVIEALREVLAELEGAFGE
jgi:hypothetical protein